MEQTMNSIKGRTTLSLSTEIIEHFQKQKREFGFNMSEWVENKYREEHMNIEEKKRLLLELQEKQLSLEEGIRALQELEEERKRKYSEEEKRFMKEFKDYKQQGFDIKAIHTRFNNLFKRNTDFDSWNRFFVEEIL